MATYKTILADPPWAQPMSSPRQRAKWSHGPAALPYPTMTTAAICKMNVGDLAAPGAHCWLWTTNAFLEDGFKVMRAWGFKYLAPIHWIKPCGMGNFVVHRSQTMLLGYREKCIFDKNRYFANLIFTGSLINHSEKPQGAYELIESVSRPRRLELFARKPRRGWESWGDELGRDLSAL